MRIISGTHKGKKIIAPKNLPVRPTTDMAKEALFNILNNHYYFDEISVLDLFSGTGSISYEFASRGCHDITAVDAHFACVKYINQTSEKLELNIDTIKSDVFNFLEKYTRKSTVIFADPPYNFEKEKFERIIELTFKNKLLEDEGVLIVEHSKHTDLSDSEYYSYSKKYGGNMFSFFEKE